MSARLVIVFAAAFVLMIVMTGEALAGARGYYVTAYSRYGNGAVRAPVRAARFGYQVRLPGGHWYYCERSGLLRSNRDPCSETLRRQSLDVWETISEDQGGGR
ncbi:MAG: hypothetical protein ACE5FM_09055 [Methyloligellaceae bacterium]